MEDRYTPSINAGMHRTPIGTSNAANSMNAPNAGTMPYMTNNTGTMPLTNAKPNAGMMPEMTAKPNTGMMPEMTAKPNTGMMPEMTAKPNTGMMPEMTAKPNTGMMPEMMANPKMGSMPSTMSKPNMGAMPYMGEKQDMATLPYMMNKPNGNVEAEMSGCGYKNGELPACAPLAVGYVPFQQKNPPKYNADEALAKGTLFPGLDLPFMNIANKTNPYAGTPLGELMALSFVIEELGLYLDTHPKDKDALEMLKTLNIMMRDGMEKYVQLYGPQTLTDITSGDEFTWLNNPWPWEFRDKGADK